MTDDFETYRRAFDAQPLNVMLGITLVEQRRDFGRIRLEVGPDAPQGIGGSVHGGILAAMVDIAMIVAVFSNMHPESQAAGTADLNITYLRQAHGVHVYADAEVIKRGRSLAMIEVSITDDEGTLCARGRVLYALRSRQATS